MNKVLLAALSVLTLGLVVWALMPAPAPDGAGDRASSADRAPAADRAASSAADPAEPDAPAKRKPTLAEAASPAEPVEDAPKGRYAGDPTPRPTLDLPPAPKLLPPVIGLPEGEIRNGEDALAGRKPDQPMPSVAIADLKSTVRRYYGNLPRSGRFPARITVEELLPPSVIAGLNVPRGSQIVEIGHYPATSAEGLVEALELPEDGQATFGVTIVTPDGQRVRDYVQTTPAE